MASEELLAQIATRLGLAESPSGTESVRKLGDLVLPADLLEHFLQQLESELAQLADRERVFGNLVDFLDASRSPQGWLALFERESDALSTLLRLIATSQYMADMLIADPEVFDLLRLTDGQPVDQDLLRDEIMAAVRAAGDSRSRMRVLRDYRHRETLRIAYGDFINGQPVDTVTRQISELAECIVQAACIAAQQDVHQSLSPPSHPDGTPITFAVLALGKLGGSELNYSSDIDLIFLRQSVDPPPAWQENSSTQAVVDEYFQRLGQKIVHMLSESTSRGIAYRVDLRLRPHGRSGPLFVGIREAIGYYDSVGRTWERQAFIKARTIAGDKELGDGLIEQLQPWVYRRYLMRADITGIAALKRRIEQRALKRDDNQRNVKLGFGGIRDIEYAIQFLQLLHGAELPEVRCQGTLEAISELQKSGCITAEEGAILEDNYRFLRRIEHFLQIMFDHQTHSLPADQAEFERLATRIAQVEGQEQSADQLSRQLETRTTRNRQILDHLLHDAFSSYGFDSQQIAFPESDLVLDPQPTIETIESTLAPYGFSDPQAAYRHLQELAVESIRFLSTRRSRHFLSAIAPKLLASIAATPNPDATLISLANVSASLGGKAVLWELFSSNPPSMELCVHLCATSPYLASILTSNPGMIDELLDSLMLDQLPTHEELSASLAELCRGAIDTAPMLHNFKNSMHLRVGVRDILGKTSIAETHTALSDIAEVCMEHVIHNEFHRLVHQLGVPTSVDEAGNPQGAELVVLAVGKLGGREPNYHSDLDVIFLFDQDGQTKSLVPNRRFEPTTNRHFFNQLCQRVIQAITQIGAAGKLYDLDVRLRPLGRSGQLAITIDDLKHYFASGKGQIWERQALCKARPIWGSPGARQKSMNCLRDVLTQIDSLEQCAQEIYDHRIQLQDDAAEGNLKRGPGGTMDVEFVVQFLQLANIREHPTVLAAGTLEAIDKLEAAGCIDEATANSLHQNYQFLRSVESGIRLMDLTARHELPREQEELQRLAFLLESEKRFSMTGTELQEHCNVVRAECRAIFEATFEPCLPVATDAEPIAD